MIQTRLFGWQSGVLRIGRISVRILDLLLWAALLALLMTGFRCAADVEGSFTPFSLRYDSAIDGVAAYNARLSAIEQENEPALWLTYWTETNLSFQSEFAQSDARAIVFSGDAALAWQAGYLRGAAPGVTDAAGCAVSEPLAYALWGAEDVVGKEVTIGGADYIVRGVFADEAEMALVSAGDAQGGQTWQAVELSGAGRDMTESDARDFARSVGLGEPDAVLQGGVPAFFARLAAGLPLLLLSVCGVVWLLRLVRNRCQTARHMLRYTALAAGLLALPTLLTLLPQWMIPDMWSDFTFWGDLWDSLAQTIEAFLALKPAARDLAGKWLLLRQAAIFFAASITAVVVAFRYAGLRVAYDAADGTKRMPGAREAAD